MLRVVDTVERAALRDERSGMKPLRIACRIRLAGLLVAIAALVVAPLDVTLGLFDKLYADGAVPRTHPLTWTCLLLGLLATLQQRPLRPATVLERSLWLAVIVMAALKPWAGAPIDLESDLHLGSMGWNTAVVFALIALGQLLRRSSPAMGLICATCGIFLPAVALNGLLLGNHDFYGEMAAPTALAVFGLGCSNLLSYARRPGFKLVLHDSAAGRLVRRQVALWIGLACALPPTLRITDLTDGSGFALFYTAQMACILAGILHFGLRFAGLLENARRLERELMRDAATDPLTGAATRRAAISHFIETNWRQKMGVILLDLDHFKQINDRHGHAVGDRVLQAAVRALRTELRLSDLIVRWGGEEFLILVPLRDRETLYARSEALRARIEEATAADSTIPAVTASLGAAIAEPTLKPDMAAVLDRADTALYEAKAAGRNRVVLYSDRAPKLDTARAA